MGRLSPSFLCVTGNYENQGAVGLCGRLQSPKQGTGPVSVLPAHGVDQEHAGFYNLLPLRVSPVPRWEPSELTNKILKEAG